MAKLQFATLTNFEEFLSLHNIQITEMISESIKTSLKSVSQSDDGYTVYFYTKTNPASVDEAAFSINLPIPVGKADKVKNAVAGNLAGLDVNGNLVDSGKKASDFETAGAAATVKSEVLGYVGSIPTSSTAANVIAFIQEIVTASEYDDAAIKALVNANTAAIGVLNGTENGSVNKTVADAIAKIVANAPESFDTLKEISDWITTHASDAAGMNSQISTNKTDISNLKKLIGSLPEGTASTTIVEYIAEYVSSALADSDLSQYAKAVDLVAAVGRIKTLEDGIAVTDANVATNASDIASLKTKMATAEGDIDALQADLTVEKPKIAANAAAITTLQGLVGDGYEPIPSASIKALFAKASE